ncbi:MAG TPA: serine/threonine protein kinase [Phycisphaerales bacterium]|nr:serine/threonine protein kinase [Phycisphaerales bacterium]
MTNNHPPTDPDAETIGMPSDDSGKGSMPEPSKIPAMGMPSEIGRYKILGIIGSGGMGHVYEAMQEAPRRRVALKVIKGGAASEMALRRFEFETQILAKLHHPNIAQIYEAGIWKSPEGEVPFFAMEYIPGRRGIIEYAQKRDLSTRDRLELFTMVCEAVHHGHQKGVIHRDLKPDNILVDTNGNPKIIDFGVARATDADLSVTTMQTTMGQLIGTLQYMSPEQCDADPDRIDTRSDVYALGVILFQLLSGKLPYDLRRQAIHEAVRVIKEQRPDSMSTISGTLRGDVDTIAQKAMEKDRNRRYQSAAELANDIGHFLNSEPIEARPLSISYQLRLFTKKYKRTCAAVFALIITIILGIFGTTWGMMEANRQKLIAVEQRDLAEDRANEIFDMTTEFVTEFYDGVKKLNAAMNVRQAVLNSGLGHLENLEVSSGVTPKTRGATAYVHARLGDVFISTNGPYLGDPEQAMYHFDMALSLYEALLAEGHDNHLFDVVHTQLRISRVYIVTDQYLEAFERLKVAKGMADKLVEQQPNENKHSILQSSVYMQLADMHYKLETPEESKVIYKELLDKRRSLAKQQPNNVVTHRNLGNILYRVAMILVQEGDLEKGLGKYREANKIYLHLAKLEPENDRATQRDVGWSHYFVGKTLVSLRRYPEGFQELSTGFNLILTRCTEFSDSKDARDNLLDYLNTMVEFRLVANQQKEAIGDCKQALLALQPIKEQFPDNYALANLYQEIQLKLKDFQKENAENQVKAQ